MNILIVDDEPDILELLDYNLSKAGYEVQKAKTGKKALKSAKETAPDLIILDLMMPGWDGIETCRRLRKIPKFKNTLIVFLTALSDDISELKSYEAGADDFITKPIRPRVLISKVKALLRRQSYFSEEKIRVGDLLMNRGERTAIFEGKPLRLPYKEFELLALLAVNPGKVFSRREILTRIWDEGVVVGDRTVDVHVRKLREKIGSQSIKTVSGVGYKLVL